MAVPSSGSVSLYGIAKEIHLDDYNNSIPNPNQSGTNWDTFSYPRPISLKNMSTGAGGFDAINSASSSKPNGSTPHGMGEFRGYDHDAISITQIGSTYSGSYSCSSWQSVSIPVSAYKGKTVRFIFHYVSGTSYTGDLQIDQVMFPVFFTFMGGMWSGINNSFGTSTFNVASAGSNGGAWQTTTTDTSSYAGASWSNVATGTTSLRWNGRSGGTPSGSTGISGGYGGSGFYVYAEVSGTGYSNKNFWLRSGTHTIQNEVGTPYFSFRLGRCGSTIGTLKVYIEEI